LARRVQIIDLARLELASKTLRLATLVDFTVSDGLFLRLFLALNRFFTNRN
jgi:hypothetical protein